MRRKNALQGLTVLKKVDNITIALTSENSLVCVDETSGLRGFPEPNFGIRRAEDGPIKFLGLLKKVPPQVETLLVQLLDKQRIIREKQAEEDALNDIGEDDDGIF
jgi:hypothetical protein